MDWNAWDIVHCGVSGGKDSQAAATWLVQDSGCPPEKIRLSFNDTGNEHELTYEHVRYIAATLGVEIVWTRAALDFYQLALSRHRFPSAKARFCTQVLKMEVTQARILPWLQSGYRVLLVTGVRREESTARAQLSALGFDDYYGCPVFRPLIEWTTPQVFAYLAAKGQQANPLYSYGARRVGCLPCIMSSKGEVRMIAHYFPERIDLIREWEGLIRGGEGSSFFAIGTAPERFASRVWKGKGGKEYRINMIDDIVRWSQTAWGGKQFEFDFEQAPTCANRSGACE